jgi:hypothetical protein
MMSDNGSLRFTCRSGGINDGGNFFHKELLGLAHFLENPADNGLELDVE